MKKTNKATVAYLARKIGEHPNAWVDWMGNHLRLSWESPDGSEGTLGIIDRKLARLLAKRILQALDSE